MRYITLLGSTGSIGTSTLDVVRRNPERFRIYALVAGQNTTLLVSQILEFQPKVVVVATETALDRLCIELAASGLPKSAWPELAWGAAARVAAAKSSEPDTVMSAIVGVTGLEATYEAVKAGKRVGLANKEVLVSAGRVVMQAVEQTGAELIPVDSEHNGAHQCLRA
ncbi:MAG: 1-deoxy-D-xylulose-5-phosphate reductoisomerase, partial [Bryobacteraceae bacterium]